MLGRKKRGRGKPDAGLTSIDVPPGFPLDAIPAQFRDALRHAPPEALEALRGFGTPAGDHDGAGVASTTVGATEVTVAGPDGEPLEETLAGTGVDPDEVARRVVAGLDLDAIARGEIDVEALRATGLDLEGVEVVEHAGPQVFSWTSVQVPTDDGSWELVVPEGATFVPGDEVRGEVVARVAMSVREVHLDLVYCDRSSEFVERRSVERLESVHLGEVPAGARLPFRFRLPDEALPNWDPAGVVAARATGGIVTRPTDVVRPDLGPFGSTYWAVLVTGVRRAPRGDLDEDLPIPVDPDLARWRGPEPPELAPIEHPKGWDVEVTVPDRTPQRGGRVEVEVTINRQDPDQDDLELTLRCDIHHDVLERRHRSGGSDSHIRGTKLAPVHEDERAVPLERGVHRVVFEIPADLPFSIGRPKTKQTGPFKVTTGFRTGTKFGGQAFGVHWHLDVRERRARRRDPRVSVDLWVTP